METEQERLGTRTYELEGELRQHQNVLGQTALELDRSENRILFNRQRTEELTGRRQQLHFEIEQASAQAAQVEARANAHGNRCSGAPGRCGAHRSHPGNAGRRDRGNFRRARIHGSAHRRAAALRRRTRR